VDYADDYAEPGYSKDGDGPVLFANWNNRTRYNRETGEYETLDDVPERLARIFERMGCSIEWEDEWIRCDDCGRAFRTQADCYSWTRSGHISEHGDVSCADCITNDPQHYLDEISGDSGKALTFDVDMEDLGYVNLCWNELGCAEGFQSGLYGGQCDDPSLIAEDLEKRGITDCIFQVDSVGQFDCAFSVWVKREHLGITSTDEWDEIYAAIERFRAAPIDSRGTDPADMCKRALEDAHDKMRDLPNGQGVKYARCDLHTGKADVRLVSPDEFINGIRN
jgi:hypothetical protein